jgi:hypothetical protein
MADTSDPESRGDVPAGAPAPRRPASKPGTRGAARGAGMATFKITQPAKKAAPPPASTSRAPVHPPAAPRAAVPMPTGDLATPAGKSRALAATVVNSFCERLVAEASRHDGVLTLQDIEALNEEFAQKTDALQAVFEKSFEDYVRARERAALQQARNYPFDRVLVSKFERLFAKDKGLGLGKLSRRMLPGFFMAMNKMLGPELIETYQERCRRIVQRIRQGRSDEFNWEEVYADRDAKALVLEAEVTIASYFEDVEKRSAWFMEVVNNNLAPAPGGAPPHVASWELTRPAFLQFLRALLVDLKAELAASDGRTRITERYGIQTCLKLAEIMRGIG